MNGSEMILAIIAACSIIAAMLMTALACRMNERWSQHCGRFADLCNQQNDLLKRMNQEWYEAYVKMVTMKAEEKNGQD